MSLNVSNNIYSNKWEIICIMITCYTMDHIIPHVCSNSKSIIFKYNHQNILKKHLCFSNVWASLLTHPITRPSSKFNNYHNSKVVMGINDIVWYLQHGNVIWKYLWFPQMTVTIHSSVVCCLHSDSKEMPNFREQCVQMKRTLYSQPRTQTASSLPPTPNALSQFFPFV